MVVSLAVDESIARFAAAQNGDITWRQLLDAGLTPSAIKHRVARRRLWHVYYSVYAVADPALLPLARPTAALLSVGDRAVLSHSSAAAVYGISGTPDQIHLTLIARKARQRTGVVMHRVTHLDSADIASAHRLRLTAPARTLIDLAAVASSSQLEAAFGEARAKHLLTDADLAEALARAPANHRGATAVRAMLAGDPDATHTRSEGERRLRRLLKQADLPQPLANRSLHGYIVDFLWPAHKLVLELDAYGTHGAPRSFERDRRRDQLHVAAGYTVIRITWRQLWDEPLAVIARISQSLAVRAPAGTSAPP